MMSGRHARGLLPTGLADLLPPEAEHEARVVEGLLAHFGRFGYERVKPPLVEFEGGLLEGPGAAMAAQTFRLMDPVSQRMMGVRADMTLQVARIATTRLARQARPLRLSYAGEVLRVRGSQLQPTRQFRQAGVELIGALGAPADAEVVLLAAEALAAVGIKDLSIDLTSPMLVPAACRELGVSAAALLALRPMLDRKDEAAVLAQGKDGIGEAAGPAAELLVALLRAAGPAETALPALAGLDLPPQARAEADRLAQVVAILREAAPGLRLTVDPVENRNFEYHTGLSFSLFVRGRQGEIGRGGRYRADGAEPATGFTLFMDAVMGAAPAPAPVARVWLPLGVPPAEARRLRDEGWVTVPALAPVVDPAAEARRLGCGHHYVDGAVVQVR